MGGVTRAAARAEGWPDAFMMKDYPLWRRAGWLDVARAWADAGWRMTLQQFLELAAVVPAALPPPQGDASRWSDFTPAQSVQLDLAGVTVHHLEAARSWHPQGVLAYTEWFDDGLFHQASAWLGKGVPAFAARAASAAGIGPESVADLAELTTLLERSAAPMFNVPGVGVLPTEPVEESVRQPKAELDGVWLRHRHDWGDSTLERRDGHFFVRRADGSQVRFSGANGWTSVALFSQLPEVDHECETGVLSTGSAVLLLARFGFHVGDNDWWVDENGSPFPEVPAQGATLLEEADIPVWDGRNERYSPVYGYLHGLGSVHLGYFYDPDAESWWAEDLTQETDAEAVARFRMIDAGHLDYPPGPEEDQEGTSP